MHRSPISPTRKHTAIHPHAVPNGSPRQRRPINASATPNSHNENHNDISTGKMAITIAPAATPARRHPGPRTTSNDTSISP